MKIKVNDDLDIKKIAYSGQCFRWKDLGDGRFLIPAFGKYVIASMDGSDLNLENCEEEDVKLWRRYFDLDRSYTKILNLIDKDDEFLYNAGISGKGVRILRQDPFETLISFIISQRKSIPAIRTSVEKICRAFGKKLGEVEGEDVYSFPTVMDLYNANIEELDKCSLGYRTPYILKAVRTLGDNPELLLKMENMDDEKLKETLLSFYGVGIKVASCTMLFGFGRLDTFPIDVWIKRALETNYKNGFPFEKYRPYNGVMQQFIFEYFRIRQ